jgi:hypothetical protein
MPPTGISKRAFILKTPEKNKPVSPKQHAWMTRAQKRLTTGIWMPPLSQIKGKPVDFTGFQKCQEFNVRF